MKCITTTVALYISMFTIAMGDELPSKNAVDPNDPPEKILKELVNRYGGQKGTDRWKCGSTIYRTTMGSFVPRKARDLTMSDDFEYPTFLRRRAFSHTEQEEDSIRVLFVYSDSGRWMKSGDEVIDLSDQPAIQQVRHPLAEAVGVEWLSKFKGTITSKLIRSDDQVSAVRVTLENLEQQVVDVTIDVETGFVLETSGEALNVFTNRVENLRTRFSDFKVIDGIPIPFKIVKTSAGKPFTSVEIQQVKFLDQHDRKLFKKPEPSGDAVLPD